jgi:hypothetical protein
VGAGSPAETQWLAGVDNAGLGGRPHTIVMASENATSNTMVEE